MVINPTIFRNYDIRGVYPQDLNEAVSRQIVFAFLELFCHVKTIVVSRDPRPSSEPLAKVISQAFVEAGREVIDLGISPDSLFYFAIFNKGFDGGFMVSGSHNPPEHNGLTLSVRPLGSDSCRDVIEKDLGKIRDLAIAGTRPVLAEKPGKISQLDLSGDYLNYVASRIKLKKPLRVVLDPSNGAVGFLPERIFRKLGCEVKTIYGEFDPAFPHHLPDPYLEENRRDAARAILENKADCGFVYDSDGDRVAPLDNRGRMISGDDCLLLLAKQALAKKKGPIVSDMRVSRAFLDEMKREGVKTYFSVSHHNAVIDKISETKAVFGGETTLHFLFPLDYYLADDGVFASLKLAEVFAEKENLAEFVDSLPRYFISPEVFIESTDEEKFKIIANLQKYLRENKFDFIDVDGARINFPHGWALARAANTGPYIKCRFEGETKEDLIEIKKQALEIFQKVGIPVTEKTYKELNLS